MCVQRVMSLLLTCRPTKARAVTKADHVKNNDMTPRALVVFAERDKYQRQNGIRQDIHAPSKMPRSRHEEKCANCTELEEKCAIVVAPDAGPGTDTMHQHNAVGSCDRR